MIKYLLTVVSLLFSISLFAKEYKISSAAELSSLKLQPGDKVILADVEWKDQRLAFKGMGTEKSPIMLTIEKPGQTVLTGNSNLLIEGDWLVVDGLYFTNGYSTEKDVISISPKSNHCRLTNSAIVNYNHPDKKIDYKWVSVWGHNNRVDHCWLEGKTHQGTTLVIWLDSIPNHDLIDHNYFGQRPDLGVNGGETIRIGNSTWSQHDSYTTVEKNVFEHCNGEIEIISNKSCKNTINDNLFYECAGTLTLRHGNDADVYNNYFIGNGLPNTGGVRVIAENHKVHHNYFQDLTGTGLSAAISIMDGLPNPPLTGHWQVKNASIYDNLIIHCKESLSIGAGKNAERYLKAENTSFTNNIIVSQGPAIFWVDDSVRIRFADNKIDASTVQKKLEGFVYTDIPLVFKTPGLYGFRQWIPDAFWSKEKTGPSWRKEDKSYTIGSKKTEP
jgi:poly(beta-D-mannuronate) lyase